MIEEDPHLTQLLNMMLEFNPYLRATPQECLQSKFFDNIRVPDLEKPAPYKIYLPIDMDDACDYENGNVCKYSREQLQQMIFEEVVSIQRVRSKSL